MSFFNQNQREYAKHLLGKKQNINTSTNYSFQPIIDKITKKIRQFQKINYKLKTYDQLQECKELAIQIQLDLKELNECKIFPPNQKISTDKKIIHQKFSREFESEIKRLDKNALNLHSEILNSSQNSSKVSKAMNASSISIPSALEWDRRKNMFGSKRFSTTLEQQLEQVIESHQYSQGSVGDQKIQDEILKERDLEIRQIEVDIKEINEIIKDTALIIKDQGEELNQAEEIIDKAQSLVYEGALEIGKGQKYQQRQKKKLQFFLIRKIGNRWLLLIIPIIIAAILVALYILMRR